MTIKRYGVEGSTGTGGQRLPFARGVEAGGWLRISGQTPMRDSEIVEGGIIEQSTIAIENCLTIMREANYQLKDVYHVTVILTDSRYFQSFNKVFDSYFSEYPPARICLVADLVLDCKVEVDLTCYKDQ